MMKAIPLIDVEKHQERPKAVWVLAASPPLAIMEEHPEDASGQPVAQGLDHHGPEDGAVLDGQGEGTGDAHGRPVFRT